MKPESGLIWAVAGLAAISAALAALPLPRRFAGDSGLTAPPPATSVPVRAELAIEPILAWSPFGRPMSAAGEADATASDLGLSLHGVVLAPGSHASRAIVSGPSGPAQTYTVGEALSAAVTLAEVHADHVVLMVDGSPRTLAFPDNRSAP